MCPKFLHIIPSQRFSFHFRHPHLQNKLRYKGSLYVLAKQSPDPKSQVNFNTRLKILEVFIPQAVINLLGSQIRKNWGECGGLWILRNALLSALKRKGTNPKLMPDLVKIYSFVEKAARSGIKRFCFYKRWTTQSHTTTCEQESTREHEKFHAFCWVLRDKHRMFKRKPLGLMKQVVDRVRDGLAGHTSKTGEDAVSIILKKIPSQLKLGHEKWVSLVDVNLWRMQKLIPKDVAAKYAQATGLNLFVEEIFADLAGADKVKNMNCRGYLSTYSEEGIEKIVDLGLTIKRIAKELLNVQAAADAIIEYAVQNPQELT